MKTILMVPRAREEKISDGKIMLSHKLCFNSDYDNDKISKLLKCFIPEMEIEYSKNAVVNICYSDKLKKEAYTLNIQNGKIDITYSDYLGIRNALASMSNLIKNDLSINEGGIYDYPMCSHRGVMLDLARGVENIDKLKEDLILIAKAKMNYIHLHFFDSQGSAIKIKSFPESSYLENAYTISEVKGIVELCDILGLDVIPEFDLPAHSTRLIEADSELMCVVDYDEVSKWTVCAGSEKVFKLYKNAISELASIFPGEYFHIGGDELEFADRPELNRLCYWDKCERCRSYMEKNNIKDRQDLYYDFILKVYDIVKKNKKTMIMWSDQIDTNREVPLPKDIIFQFWRVAGEGRGPYINCSMNNQLKLGNKVINSNYPDTYVEYEAYMNSEKLKDWLWDEKPECDSELKESIIGSEICAWEYGNHSRYPHYAYSLPSAVVISGDKLWNKDSLPYSEKYEEAVTRTVIGLPTPEGLNVFKCIGDILPPRCDKKIYKEKVKCSNEEIGEVIGKLEEIEGNIRARAYRECIIDGLNTSEDVEVIEGIEN